MNPFTDEAFRREHGSYLCNVKPGLAPVRGRPGTCDVCGAPLQDYSICYPCHTVREASSRSGTPFPLAHLAFLTYTAEWGEQVQPECRRDGRQAYTVLKGYKSPQSSRFIAQATRWAGWFLGRWAPWEVPLGGPGRDGWAWATVPTTHRERSGEHPLHRIVTALLGAETEAQVQALRVSDGRSYDPALYECSGVAGMPVLIVEDSWVSGMSVFSLGAALRQAGATTVCAMVLGRTLNPGRWSPAADFINSGGLRLEFDPSLSPWTKVR